MTVLRSALFMIAFYLWTLVLGIAYLPLLVLPRAPMVAAGRLWCCGTLFLLGAIVGLRHRVEGSENVPDRPAIYAFKHQSAWETLVVCLLIRDPAIVLKRELLPIPVFGWYLWKHDMIAIDRWAGSLTLRRLVAAAAEKLTAGRSPVVFPEGTRTAPGQRVPYQSGVAALYGRLGVSVVPVALNSGLFWRRRAFVKHPGCITVRFLPPIPPGLDRHAFMTRLEDVIETASTELLSGPAAWGFPQAAPAGAPGGGAVDKAEAGTGEN